MKSTRLRTLAALLALAGAGTQPAAGSPLLVGALMLGMHASGHAHSLSILSDAGHLDLVLSHAEGPGHDPGHGGAPHPEDRPTTAPESDHVFHVANDDAARTTPRRHRVSDAPAPVLALAVTFAPLPAWIFRPSSEPRVRAADPQGTIVLRL